MCHADAIARRTCANPSAGIIVTLEYKPAYPQIGESNRLLMFDTSLAATDVWGRYLIVVSFQDLMRDLPGSGVVSLWIGWANVISWCAPSSACLPSY